MISLVMLPKTNIDVIKGPNKKFALVIQGGGMRGVYSAGILAKFIEAGLISSFSDIVANSAGALNGAYFLANQPGAVNVYIDLLSTKKFIDLTRRVKKIDIDYMVDVALHEKYPIDLRTLRKSETKLHIIVTDSVTGKKYVIDDKDEFKKIYEEFRATAALPILYDKKIKINKRYFIDGGISDLIPVETATSYKPTDIIVIMTRPIKDYNKKLIFRSVTKSLIKRVAKNQPEIIKNQLPTNQEQLTRNIRLIKEGFKDNINIHVISPKERLIVNTSTINRQKLEQVGELGWADGEAFLNSTYK